MIPAECFSVVWMFFYPIVPIVVIPSKCIWNPVDVIVYFTTLSSLPVVILVCNDDVYNSSPLPSCKQISYSVLLLPFQTVPPDGAVGPGGYSTLPGRTSLTTAASRWYNRHASHLPFRCCTRTGPLFGQGACLFVGNTKISWRVSAKTLQLFYL